MQDAKNKYFKKEYLIEAHFYVKGRFKLHVPDCVKSSSIPFHFGLVLRSKCIYRKKLNVKTLSGPYTKRKHPTVHSKMCHLAMADEQSHGVKLGNTKIADYNSSRIRYMFGTKNLRATIVINLFS